MSITIPQEEPHFVALPARATSPLLLRSRTTMLEQIALREILLQEEIQGLSAPGPTPFRNNSSLKCILI
jgi:hypothetical protein